MPNPYLDTTLISEGACMERDWCFNGSKKVKEVVVPAAEMGTEQHFWAKQENRLFFLPPTILLPIEGGTEISMVAKLQESKSEKRLKASGDDKKTQKRFSGDLPASDKPKTDKTENLESSVGFAPRSPVRTEMPKVQFGSLPRDKECHGPQKGSTSKAQLVTVERSEKCECKGICCCTLNEVMALCKATELEECILCGGCIEDARSKEQALHDKFGHKPAWAHCTGCQQAVMLNRQQRKGKMDKARLDTLNMDTCDWLRPDNNNNR